MLKLSSTAAVGGALQTAPAHPPEGTPPPPSKPVHQYEIFELQLDGPSTGNPYVDVHFEATFTCGHRSVTVEGFYDGGSTYKVRFMPDTAGAWTFSTTLKSWSVARQSGSFECLPARPGVHGPVGIARTNHFAHADGAPYLPFGTTCYAWTHQGDELEQQTLASLKASPFNKVRMCIFPKSYEYNHNEPQFYPFVRPPGTALTSPGDTSRFNPAFWAHLEERIGQLRDLGIEADLIVFHPYDRWGFASMSTEDDTRYVRYLVARLASYSNVWWSLANEFDLMKAKSTQDFDRLLRLVDEYDPYRHLRSIHYSKKMYDYGSPLVTHASLQTTQFDQAPAWLAAWNKPIVFDEVMYEGNLRSRWGNLAGEEMTRRYWLGVVSGCYVTHGETYLLPNEIVWWAKGGRLTGSSPERIAYLRSLIQAIAPEGLEAAANPYYLNAGSLDRNDPKLRPRAILYYFDFHQPAEYEFPLGDGIYRAQIIDTWAMTSASLEGTFSGRVVVSLPGKPYLAALFRLTAG